MPALSNIVLSDTFDDWRIRTNQVIVKGNQEEIRLTNAYDKANNALANTSGATFNGNLNITGNLTSSNTMSAIHFDNVSDISYKENIHPIVNSIKTISQLNPIAFDWKNTKSRSYGLIAQEVEKVIPSIVHEKDDGTKTINYIEIIAFLIQAIKEQQQQIDDINNRNNNA